MITEHKDTDLFWITDDFYNLFDTMMEVEVVNAPRFFYNALQSIIRNVGWIE